MWRIGEGPAEQPVSNDVDTLEQDGIDRPKVYEIVAWIGLKTLSNSVNHLAHTPIDEAFGSV